MGRDRHNGPIRPFPITFVLKEIQVGVSNFMKISQNCRIRLNIRKQERQTDRQGQIDPGWDFRTIGIIKGFLSQVLVEVAYIRTDLLHPCSAHDVEYENKIIFDCKVALSIIICKSVNFSSYLL